MGHIPYIKTYAPDTYKDMYLDYVNNFLTITRFAEYYGIGESYAEQIIMIGRNQHNLSVEIAQCKEPVTT